MNRHLQSALVNMFKERPAIRKIIPQINLSDYDLNSPASDDSPSLSAADGLTLPLYSGILT